MKKLLTACFVIVFAIAIQASATDNTKALSDRMKVYSHQFLDTIPKDTTKKDTMFSSAFAYRIASDTMPRDTIRKDSSFQAFAFNR